VEAPSDNGKKTRFSETTPEWSAWDASFQKPLFVRLRGPHAIGRRQAMFRRYNENMPDEWCYASGLWVEGASQGSACFWPALRSASRRLRRTWVISALSILFLPSLPFGQSRSSSGLETMLASFASEHDTGKKEAILYQITSRFGEAAGPGLLDVAIRTEEPDARWLAIRGIGYVKFKGAVPKLIEWLRSPEPYVRANAANALGEIHADAAKPLVELLANEMDGGVVEQTAAALEMLRATAAIPALEQKANHPSPQTRMWVIGAVEVLGSRRELPFFGQCLYDQNIQVAAQAAGAIERLAAQDFGFSRNPLSGLGDLEAPVLRARLWWERTQGR
jgi:HEAT repeats